MIVKFHPRMDQNLQTILSRHLEKGNVEKGCFTFLVNCNCNIDAILLPHKKNNEKN